MRGASGLPWRASTLVTWGAALAIAALWSASLPLGALELGQSPLKWYDGVTMFLGGAARQVIVLQSFPAASHWYLAWWSNLALLLVVLRLALLSRPGLLISSLPLALAAFAFTIRAFGLPDDPEAPVVGYGAGFWLWMAAMAVPLALRLVTSLVRQVRRPVESNHFA